jgi:hypothetical protein
MTGIKTSFENEFLAYFVMADGITVGERLAPQLEAHAAGKGGALMLEGPKPAPRKAT